MPREIIRNVLGVHCKQARKGKLTCQIKLHGRGKDKTIVRNVSSVSAADSNFTQFFTGALGSSTGYYPNRATCAIMDHILPGDDKEYRPMFCARGKTIKKAIARNHEVWVEAFEGV